MLAHSVLLLTGGLLIMESWGLTLRMQEQGGRGRLSSYSDYLDEANRKGTEAQRVAVVRYVQTEEEMVEAMSNLRVAFLPDVGVDDNQRWWYQAYYAHLATTTQFSPMEMPNPFSLMTKRYEVHWVNYMRGLNLNTAFDLVVAHGTSAEAMLRYLESDKVQSCVLIDASDIYTAGERHGRRFHVGAIKKNCAKIELVSTTYNTLSDELLSLSDDNSSPSPLMERVTAELKRITCRKGQE